MKKTRFMKRFLALMLCFLMILSTIPTTAFAAETGKTTSVEENTATQSGEDAVTTEDYGKVYVTSNVEDVIWTNNSKYDITGITDKPVIWLRVFTTDGILSGTLAPIIKILNYTQLSESYTLDYISFDGHQISLSDFSTGLTAIDTSEWSDSALQGKTIKRNLNDGCPNIVFAKKELNNLSADANIAIQFKKVKEDKANLTVTAGEHGSFVESKYIDEKEDGTHEYTVYAKPDLNYQLSSYTINGTGETVDLDLTAENYRWVENDNFFTIAIEKDMEITLNFTPATVELEFWSYVTADNPESSWNVDMFGRIFDSDGTDIWKNAFEKNKQSIPLVAEMGAKFFFKVNIKGFKEYGTEGENCQIKLYSGTKAAEENLLFDSTQKTYILNNTQTVNNRLRGDRCGGIQVYTANIPNDMKNIYVELDYAGYKFTGSYPVQMATDLAEVKEFVSYYTTNYGLDKQGKEAYTAEEKLTEECLLWGYSLFYNNSFLKDHQPEMQRGESLNPLFFVP